MHASTRFLCDRLTLPHTCQLEELLLCRGRLCLFVCNGCLNPLFSC